MNETKQELENIELQEVINPSLLHVHQHVNTMSQIDSSATVGSSFQSSGKALSASVSLSVGDAMTDVSRSAASKHTFTSATKSTRSKTSETSTSVTLRTCCGTVELDCVRIVSLFGMIVNIAAFVIILAIYIQTYVYTSYPIISVLDKYENLVVNYQNIYQDVYTSVVTRNSTMAKDWYLHKHDFVNSWNDFLASFPSHDTANATDYLSSELVLPAQEAIIGNLIAGNQETLPTNFTSNVDTVMQAITTTIVAIVDDIVVDESIVPRHNEIQLFLTELLLVVDIQFDNMMISTGNNLIVVCVCLGIALPVCILIFVLTIRKERSTAKHLRVVNLSMLLSTMADPFFKDLFGQYCQSTNFSSYFMLLDTLQQIKQGLQKLLFLSQNVQDSQANSSDNEDSSSTSSSLGEEDETAIRSRVQVLLADLNNTFIDPPMSAKLTSVRFIDTIGVKTVCEIVNQPLVTSQKSKKKHALSVVIENIEKAQKYVGESLIDIHSRFKQKLQHPASTKKVMLRDYRILFKKQFKNYQSTSFTTLDLE